jgi:hypothetical protein
MTDSAKKRPPTVQAQLDGLVPPLWLADMRRYFAQHGTFRPGDVARLRREQIHSTEKFECSTVSTATLLQQTAHRLKK